MRPRPLATLAAALRLGVGAVSVGFIAMFLVVAVIHLTYPFELEWMEGGMVDHVQRVLRGEPLYVAPSVDFVPFIYTPLYSYVSALAARVLGIGFEPLRLVSLLASVGCLLLIFACVARETHDRFAALVSAGLFAATYRLGGAWLDIARVDTLFLALFLAFLYLLRGATSVGGQLAAGATVALSFLTKQTALMMALPVLAADLVARRRTAIPPAATAAAAIGGSVIAFDLASHGWFSYYAFSLPSQHPWVLAFAGPFWTRDMLGPFAVAAAVAAYGLLARPHRPGATWFWASTLVGTVGGSFVSRLHTGGYDNVLIPAFAGFAIVAGLGLASVNGRLQDGRRGQVARIGVLVLLLAQFGLLRYDPRALLPSQRDEAAGRDFLAQLAGIKGDVYVPFHGFLPTLVGKQAHAHAQAIADIWEGRADDRVRASFLELLREAFRQRRFSAVITDQDWFSKVGLDETYERVRPVFTDLKVFTPVTGMPWRPSWVWVPKVDGSGR